MSRLIDADALPSYTGTMMSASVIAMAVKNAPTIDAVEVVHGEWKIYERPNGGYYTGCSVCSFPLPTDSQLDFMDETDSKYCPNCGAKMDGEVKNDG